MPSNSSSPFNKAPPPVNIMPLSIISAANSGGVFSMLFMASKIVLIASLRASLISLELTCIVLGRPDTKSLPLHPLYVPLLEIQNQYLS